MKLILASESPRRRELLSAAGFRFERRSAAVEEAKVASDPAAIALFNARLKARAVAGVEPEALVLGADTVVLHGGRIIGKPRDLQQAREILRSLSGDVHEVVTGLALISEGNGIDEGWSEVTRVRFLAFSDEQIERYLSMVQVLDKAGAYGIQEHGELLVESVDGEVENVIGLPLRRLSERLKELGAGI